MIKTEHQIRMLLKDRVTLKTGVMTAGNSALPSKEYIALLFYCLKLSVPVAQSIALAAQKVVGSNPRKRAY